MIVRVAVEGTWWATLLYHSGSGLLDGLSLFSLVINDGTNESNIHKSLPSNVDISVDINSPLSHQL